MNQSTLTALAMGATFAVKNNPLFPYKNGHLKNATSWETRPNGFDVVFNMKGAHYIPYLEFGVRHQFYWRHSPKQANLKAVYTKGSMKHVGFIRERAMQDVFMYLTSVYGNPISVENYSQTVRGFGK